MNGTIKSRLTKLEQIAEQRALPAEREQYFEWLRSEAERIRREEPEYIERLRQEAMRRDATQTT